MRSGGRKQRGAVAARVTRAPGTGADESHELEEFRTAPIQPGGCAPDRGRHTRLQVDTQHIRANGQAEQYQEVAVEPVFSKTYTWNDVAVQRIRARTPRLDRSRPVTKDFRPFIRGARSDGRGRSSGYPTKVLDRR
jgi:hypothetical protein